MYKIIPSTKAVVPNLFDIRDWFYENNFFRGSGGGR